MNISTNSSQFSQKDLKRFRELLKEQTGLLLEEPKLRQRLRRVLRKKIETRDVNSFQELIESFWYEDSYYKSIQDIANECLVNETLFYRYQNQMDVISGDVLSSLRSRKEGSTIQVLSVGCSTGAEPYTLAIDHLENCRNEGIEPDERPLEIIGIDVSTATIEDAKQGVYEQRTVENAPEDIVDRYFDQIDSHYYELVEEVKELVSFQSMNALTTSPPLLHDLILCRNVMMYFDDDTREKLIKRLHSGLKAGGFVVVSPSENLKPYPELFRPTSWTSHHVYEAWTTDRRRATISMHSGDQESHVEIERRSDLLSKPPASVDSHFLTNENIQWIKITGIASQNTSIKEFRGDMLLCLRPDAKEYYLDLRQARYISNVFLRALRKPIEIMRDESRKVSVITEREEYIRWINLSYDDRTVQVVESIPDKTQTEIEEVTFEVTQEESKTDSREPVRIEKSEQNTGDNSGDSQEQDASFVEPLVNVNTEKNKIKLRGRYDATAKPGFQHRFEEELMNSVETLAEQEHRDTDRIVLELDEVDYFDRNLVSILNRLKRRIDRAPLGVDIHCDDSLRSTLKRWGCELF